jgi:hypothetical protein
LVGSDAGRQTAGGAGEERGAEHGEEEEEEEEEEEGGTNLAAIFETRGAFFR